MARAQVIFYVAGGVKGSNAGTSSTGDIVIEVDLTKFKNFTQLKDYLKQAEAELQGYLPG